ncbi:hypothetical protein [Ruminococcus sp.]|uniref:hypothetical protein n=1 Tax=Ruminococcus sp. TaxID=41978 RepID=UPI0035223A1A
MRIQNCIMTKKQIIQISMLSVHGIILLCSIINIVICILQHKLLVFPLSYGFFNIPLYRYISSGRVIDFFALIAFIIISVVFTILECKEIIKGKTSIFILSNAFFVGSCCYYTCYVNMAEFKYFYSLTQLIFLGISMLLGMCALTVIEVIQSASIVINRTEEDLKKSKYINKNKLIIIFIGLFVFVLITEYFMDFDEFYRNMNIFQGLNVTAFTKYIAYALGIYLGVGSILQSVKRICKLKKANFLNGNEQIAMFRNDRNKKIIALAVFILSYFVFYLF